MLRSATCKVFAAAMVQREFSQLSNNVSKVLPAHSFCAFAHALICFKLAMSASNTFAVAAMMRAAYTCVGVPNAPSLSLQGSGGAHAQLRRARVVL